MKVSKRTRARRKLVAKLDAEAKRRVFERDKAICQRCGDTATEWSHVFSREYRITRWEDDNALAQCKGCEYFATNHRDRWHAWVSQKWPDRWNRMLNKLLGGEQIKEYQIKEMAEAIT